MSHVLEQRTSLTFSTNTTHPHRVFIALGSNEGQRVRHIEKACREMERRGLRITRTSLLYESEPMYVQDQGRFLNGVCEVETDLDPQALLETLKNIEQGLGRVKTIDNGPRPIDLDILLYDNLAMASANLTIPHPRIQERPFVLRPLCDLEPLGSLPNNLATFKEDLAKLDQHDSTLTPVTPVGPDLQLRPHCRTQSTQAMAVLNMTPDSFSDGGDLINQTPDAIVADFSQTRLPMIIDVGGQSTRPNASPISADEEIARVLPTIQAFRRHSAFDQTAISIDTYRASVAAAAVEAGANIVNDISAGRLDHDMMATVARLGCTFALMHTRGDPTTMTKLTSYPQGVLRGVGRELVDRVRAAERAGIRRWRMILDPGIGFAKTMDQNLELIRHMHDLRHWPGLEGLPWMVGVSRKGFIGKITGVEHPQERVWGTAACVTALVQQKVDIVRVHDVQHMTQVLAMANALFRPEYRR